MMPACQTTCPLRERLERAKETVTAPNARKSSACTSCAPGRLSARSQPHERKS